MRGDNALMIYCQLIVAYKNKTEYPPDKYLVKTQVNCGSKTFSSSNPKDYMRGCMRAETISSLYLQWLTQCTTHVDGQQIFAEWFYQKYGPFSK